MYENGSLEDKTIVYFNLQQAIRGVPAGPERDALLMQRVSNLTLFARFEFGVGGVDM